MTAVATPINADLITNMITETLRTLGNAGMDSVAYDTAWTARLDEKYPNQGFKRGLEWLRRNQNPDGSWGEPNFVHYHDRYVSTLAAIIALHTTGKHHKDKARIRAGERYLWQIASKLRQDPHDTIGFPVISLALIQEARTLGLDIPRETYFDPRVIEKKLNQLGSDPSLWHHHTILCSFEGIVQDFLREPADGNLPFLSGNGSILLSPAATSALLLHLEKPHQDALKFVKGVFEDQGDGGMPALSPIELYETAWAVDSFRTVGALSPTDPEVKRVLDLLWSGWSAERGIACSEFFSITDLDDTSATFSILNWAGYPVDAETFSYYECETHFSCYKVETNLGWSAMIRMLRALNEIDSHPKKAPWIKKLLANVHRDDLTGQFFFDKWHVSPFYLRSTAIHSLWNYEPEMTSYLAKWIMQTQNADGGWGFGASSTREETAYCVNALIFWDKLAKNASERVDPDIIEQGAHFLADHVQDTSVPALWIGKSLYNPVAIEKAAVLSALFAYLDRKS